MDYFDDLHDGLANHFFEVSKGWDFRVGWVKADRERLLPQEPPYVEISRFPTGVKSLKSPVQTIFP